LDPRSRRKLSPPRKSFKKALKIVVVY